MRVLSLFSGIGAFEKALSRIGIDYELVNYCEIDKHASKSYSQIHNVNEDLNLWDVTTVDTSKLPKNIDLLTHGSPCQDFSLAGKQAGGDKGSGTRSSLMYETVRIVKDVKPKIVIWENVKNVLSKKHRHNFNAYVDSLNNLNYNSYYEVLNAKDYGIPQNRERIFVVSIRKDIDNGNFIFPEPFELKLRLKDILEDKVEEKYYLSQQNDYGMTKTNLNDIGVVVDDTRNMKQILCDKLIEDGLVEEGDVIRHSYTNNRLNNGVKNMGRTESKDKLCPTLDTRCDCLGVVVKDKNLWTDTQKQMITDDGNIKRYIDSDIVDEFKEGQVADISFPNGYNKGNRVHNECPTINTTTTQSSFIIKESQIPLRIRKFTPKECWRLQGFDDDSFEKAAKVNSNASLYKQAGNSIVVNILEAIFDKLKPYLEKGQKSNSNNY